VTSHPKWVSEEFLAGLRDLPLACEHFHIPCQAGDDEILKRMNRKYTAAEYENKVEMIRNYFPAAGITADVIVGFPDETDARFENTLSLLNRVRVNQAYMFMYSTRPGTAAERMKDDVPFETKAARLQTLIKLQREISLEHNQKVIGTEMEIMVDHCGPQPGKYKGRTRCNRVADFASEQSLKPGDVVIVNIESASPYALRGKIIT
jgi:tRNA-2-methylthio-N6-dimethylallyladenosine synthase